MRLGTEIELGTALCTEDDQALAMGRLYRFEVSWAGSPLYRVYTRNPLETKDPDWRRQFQIYTEDEFRELFEVCSRMSLH